jgi:toxin ParE1/3/4
MRVVFEEEALEDLRQIYSWISSANQRAAADLVTRVFDKVEVLATPGLAEMGRPGLEPGTRELIEYPYIIVYEVNAAREASVIGSAPARSSGSTCKAPTTSASRNARPGRISRNCRPDAPRPAGAAPSRRRRGEYHVADFSVVVR